MADFNPVTSIAGPVTDGSVYRGQYTLSVGNVRSAIDCHFRCQQHPACISFIVTAMPADGYNCELNDSDDTALQTADEGAQCYMFEPYE